MCGVAGVLYFDGRSPSVDLLRTMSSALAHRGPDGVGDVVLGPCGLAHRRLSIIDLSEAGHQPMSTDDEGLWISYNGEVYNYLELREELEARGCRFRSHTDTEVILQAYRQFGLDAFERLNGMWGLALYDARERRLLLSRDRLGIKPLYLHVNDRRLLFASEIKAILAAEPALAQPNLRNIARHFVQAQICFLKESFFEHIDAVEPGTVVVFEASGARRETRYWTFTPPSDARETGSPQETERVRELLIDAVRLRFRSDVPVGTCLSGGIDSSSIVACAKRRLGLAPETFSAVYSEPGFDESGFVRLMVEQLELRENLITPNGLDLPDVLERATYYQDGPTVGPGVYTQWHVMRVASSKVKVLLDGQGADELFAGYFHDFDPYVRSLLRRARGGSLGALLSLWRAHREMSDLVGRDPVREILRGALIARGKRYGAAIRKRLALPSAGGLAARRGGDELDLRPTTDEVHQKLRDDGFRWDIPRITADPLTDAQWDQLVRTSLPALLHYEDRNSMAFSIEARTPFLDYRLVEYSLGIAPTRQIVGARTKAVLRDAMTGIIPDAVRDRRDKKGYPTPFSRWIRTHQKSWLRELVLSRRALERGFTRRAPVERMIELHNAGTRDFGWQLYRLATMELYCRRFLDGPFHPSPAPR